MVFSACAGVAALLLAASGGGDAPLAPPAAMTKLAGVAKELAAKGRGAEVDELLDVLLELHEDPGSVAKTRDDCAKALAKVHTAAPPSALTGIAHGLHGIATDLGKELANLGDDPRGRLATQILRLDDDQPAAHQVFGHTRGKNEWVDPEWTKLLARRAEIQAAIAATRKLEVPLTKGPSTLGILTELGVTTGAVVRYGAIEFHSDLPADRLERTVRRGLQAMALAKFLRGFPLEIPVQLRREVRRDVVLLSSKALYLQAIERAVAGKRLEPAEAERVKKLSGFYDKQDREIEYDISEVSAYASLVSYFGFIYYDPDSVDQPCLVAGHLNWLCLTLFGTTLPGIAKDPAAAGGDAGQTSDRPRNTPEEKRARELADAGISGARRWLLFKAARGEDPAWSHSFVANIADLVDFDLLKSTFVAEFLQEASRFDPLLRASQMKIGEKRSRAEVIEAALPEGLRGFEQRFHAWLLPRHGGLAQRLTLLPPEAEKPSRDELAAIAALDRVRKSCWDEEHFGPFAPLLADRDLTAGCAAHGRYLKLHPDQLDRWPDAHEEYPEQAGFSSEGCWSGTHSVIAPGVASADEAIADWLGTFYHRLPLLEPGLKRIGCALEGKVAVLDADSLVEPDPHEGVILFPPRGGKDVPTRFTPGGELPHPVPGVDEREFGYPITLQTSHLAVEYQLKLVRGEKAEGPEVAAYLSTPGAPTYLDAAPANASCLMPKARLDPRTKYTVVASPSDGGPTIVWSFTTGD